MSQKPIPKKYIKTVGEAVSFIQSIYPSRGYHSHFFATNISNRGKEAYEFNIKCSAKRAPWVEDEWQEYNEAMYSQLEYFVEGLKEDFSWIEECFTAGRSGGWLVITTYDRVYDDWEESDRLMNGKETVKRANDLRKIKNRLRKAIYWLENMTVEECEDFWAYCKPDDWEEQVRQKEEASRLASEQRRARMQEVIDYKPDMDTFYMITNQLGDQFIVNDRGDIIGKKGYNAYRFTTYGQAVPGNPYTGWNRIYMFQGSGIAPKQVYFEDAYSKGVAGLRMSERNAPSGQYSAGGHHVSSMWRISKERVDHEMGYVKKAV